MTETLLVAGTASHVGKSTVSAGLCRLLANQGVSVAPFKAQNMSNNAQVVSTPDGDWGEIGVSQYTQARAARITPTTDANPVLLKPRGDGESQLIIHGKAVGHFAASDYYEGYWEWARESATEAYERLAADYDVVVAEGAGSIAEINLHDHDLANLETARFADASILLLVDIERGGAFASLYGTLELLPDDIRERVVGAAITKFRGDPSLLEEGIEAIESRIGVPILGVLPYDDPGLPEEDSLSLPDVNEVFTMGDEDGVPDERTVTVAVPRLPHISNVTDFEPLADELGLRVRYVPLNGVLSDVDAVILPGTKNTVDDLRALYETGFDQEIRTFLGPIIGLCGGYQMLGQAITNASLESTEEIDYVEGLGLLPVTTTFETEKRLERVSVPVDGMGPIAEASGTVEGYEIHMGKTSLADGELNESSIPRPIGDQSIVTDGVLGTYLHGLFENENVRTALVTHLFERADIPHPNHSENREDPFEKAASILEGSLDTSALGVYSSTR
ncbi:MULTISPECIES: cobyric acid synthase [unclassified Haladaptatus]|uniref:cobyric acid synthase n=1 Tax=unclassified Haladaptatus TaxID=2622732 RepID=UPI00209BF437|nr:MULTISPECIES: cobyric acid synthase [unclassified Haladaptatus]MCO8245462.1 cobyric acid synthase [Haladaptatus sp. AB643]MCO8256574.1 cobyric acid synthase [Haladaptatus sp. AB618]